MAISLPLFLSAARLARSPYNRCCSDCQNLPVYYLIVSCSRFSQFQPDTTGWRQPALPGGFAAGLILLVTLSCSAAK